MIYGAGAVGGVIGGLLALSCTPVLLIGRPGNVEVILKHGLRIVTPGGTHTIRVAATPLWKHSELFFEKKQFIPAVRPASGIT